MGYRFLLDKQLVWRQSKQNKKKHNEAQLLRILKEGFIHHFPSNTFLGG